MKNETLIAISLFILLTSCGSYFQKKEQLSPAVDNNQQGAAPSEDIVFETVKKNILEPNCIKCHQNYSFYESVRQNLDSIIQNVETNRMPKNSQPLSDEQKKLLIDWVAGGAKNIISNDNQQKPNEPVLDDKLMPTWPSLSKKIFFARCTTCHSPNGEAKFLDLSSRQKIFESYNRKFEGKALLNFESPAESYLLTVIQDPLEPMPPKSSKFSQLNKTEIEILTEWIRLGLP